MWRFWEGLVQPNGYCRHCGRILNKPSIGSAGDTSRLPAVTTAAPLRGSTNKQSSVIISKGPGAHVDSNVSQGIGPSAIPRKVFVETRAAPASSSLVSSRKRQRPAQGALIRWIRHPTVMPLSVVGVQVWIPGMIRMHRVVVVDHFQLQVMFYDRTRGRRHCKPASAKSFRRAVLVRQTDISY